MMTPMTPLVSSNFSYEIHLENMIPIIEYVAYKEINYVNSSLIGQYIYT
jgi:hypothetical protein